jgi:DNA (cytosine-5)-methyltransferase 1
VNHWDLAIESHTANLSYAKHLCMSLDQINPREAVPGGHLHLMMASPECTHHSNAAGGRPRNEQSRATAWHVIKWAQELTIDNILIENVREMMNWGPLGPDGRPDPTGKGDLFRAFIGALEACGYNVDWRVLCAADYGDATTRERLFIQCRKRPHKITWPEPTHARNVEVSADLFSEEKLPWRSARDIINWDIPGKSIFGRKKPLAKKTLARIGAGLKKFGGEAADPFLLMLYGTGTVRDIDLPLPTVTAGGQHVALCEPFVVNMKGKSTARDIDQPLVTQTTRQHQYLCEPFVLGQQSGGAPRSVENPIPTVSTSGAIELIQPVLTPCDPIIVAIDQRGSNGCCASAIDSPITTVTTKNRHVLVEPFMINVGGPTGSGRQPKSVNDPLNTILKESHTAVIEPFVMAINHVDKQENGRRCFSMDDPMRTLTTEKSFALVEPFLMAVNHPNTEETGQRCYPVDKPLGTLTTKGSFAKVDSFLVKYYGSGIATSLDGPLDTITTKDRFGLVTIDGQDYQLDIRLRMLEPTELADAHSMGNHIFAGSRANKVKQIGNGVPAGLSEALTGHILNQYADVMPDIPVELLISGPEAGVHATA